jgi:hypothetical protein
MAYRSAIECDTIIIVITGKGIQFFSCKICTCPRHEVKWQNGGKAPPIHSLGTKWTWQISMP